MTADAVIRTAAAHELDAVRQLLHPSAATVALKVEAANRRALAFYDREGFAVRRAAIEDGARVLHLEKPLT